MKAVRAHDAAARRKRLANYHLLDGAPDAQLAHVTQLACDLFDAPIAMILLFAGTKARIVAGLGLTADEIPIGDGICAALMRAGEPLVIADAAVDPPLLSAVSDTRFCVAAPLCDGRGNVFGALVVADVAPRQADKRDVATLSRLARLALDSLEAHKLAAIARAHKQTLARTESVLAMNEQLGRILDQSVNEIYILEPQTLDVIHVNRTARENLGYSDAELQRMTALDFKADWDCHALNAMLEPLRKGVQDHVFCRGHHRRKDGSVYPIEGVVETSEFGAKTVLVAIVTDITQKVADEQLLQQTYEQLAVSEQRFQRLYRQTPAMMYSLTRDRRFVAVSDAFLERLGYSREEVIDHPFPEFIAEESERKAQSEILPRFWRDGYCKDVAYQFIAKSGEVIDVEFSALLIRDSSEPDAPVIHTVINDVTARNRAQFELAIRERQFRAVLSDTPGLVARLLPDSTLTFINATFSQILGHKEEGDLLGQQLAKLLPDDEARLLFDKINSLTPDAAVHSYEQKVRDSEGRTAWRWWSMRGYFNEIGEIVEVQFIGRDITEIKSMQMELAAKNALLEQTNSDLMRANESLNQFAYIASHDLQEPLRKISTFVSLLKRAVDTRNEQEMELAMPVIVDSVNRARDLVSDILTYSRIANSEMSKGWINLRHAVHESLETLSEAVGEAAAEVEENGLDVDVRADRGQIMHLLHNLLSNAIKYRSPERGPRITIAAHEIAGTGVINLEVSDNGIGIDPAYTDAIFEPFRRLHSRAHYPGTGIGLAICQTVARRHGWKIEVDSAPGKGSTFRVTIPSKASLRLAS